MSSSHGSASYDADDWLDIGDGSSLPSLTLDDVLDEIGDLDDELSFEQVTDGDTSASPFGDYLGADECLLTYKLDSSVFVESHHKISHQISSAKQNSGTPVAIAERNGRIAVATNRGCILMFDLDGKLDRYHQGDIMTGAASCLAFSLDGKYLAAGFCRGSLKVINTKTGYVQYFIEEACQPGMGLLEILYLSRSSSLLTLDPGGSVYELRLKTRLTGKKDYSIRCIFSGCNGEVVHMRLLPNGMLALLTVSKLLLVSARFGGSVLGSFPLNHSYTYPPLFTYWLGETQNNNHEHMPQSMSPLKALSSKSLSDLRICANRGTEMTIFRLSLTSFSTKNKPAKLLKRITLPEPIVNLHWISENLIIGIDEKGYIWQIDTGKGTALKSYIDRIEIIYSIADFKALATGGKVSDAMKCLAEVACFQSMCYATSTSDRFIVLAHDGLKIIEKVSDWEQVERFRERGDEISAALYLLDVFRGKVKTRKRFMEELSNKIEQSIRLLLDITMNGCKEGSVAKLVAHYKKYIKVLLHVCIYSKKLEIFYEDVWNRLSTDYMSKNILLDSIDEYVLDGYLIDPPPTVVCEYLEHLASDGHFSQYQSAVVRFPIHKIDLHTVMSTCRKNGLYDGIIYVMNNALNDFISPLEEMLESVRKFASNEMFSDDEIVTGNRLLQYIQCCFSGRAYPFGMLKPDQQNSVPLEVYRCIFSLKGKDGSSSVETYPNLRLLVLFDPQQFVHVISTCADGELFQSDGRLQRIIDTIGLICVSLRQEAPLLNFLTLVSQLTERGLIVPPVEIIQDVIIELLRIPRWVQGQTENAIVSTIKVVTHVRRDLILRFSQTPMRPAICSFIYLNERKFIDLVKCYIDSNNPQVFKEIENIFRGIDLEKNEIQTITKYVEDNLTQLIHLDSKECAKLIINHFADYLKTMVSNDESKRKEYFPILLSILEVRKENNTNMISGDEDIDEALFGNVFEGICNKWDESIYKELDDILIDLLKFWLPIGSRSDFCLNIAVSTVDCIRTVVCLLESRGHIDRAFNKLYEKLEELLSSNINEYLLVYWLDELFSFCARHSLQSHENGWMLLVFKLISKQIGKGNNEEEMKTRLHYLYRKILDNGTENAGIIVESLLKCPSFLLSSYHETVQLILDIIEECEFESNLTRQLLNVMNSENSILTHELMSNVSKQSIFINKTDCLTCLQPLNKSAYVYKCGHVQHIECTTNKSCPCNNQNNYHREQSLIESKKIFERKIVHKDIFSEWDKPLDLKPSN